MKLSTAWRAANTMVAIENAEGEIASELICPYPPGIPLLIPGEKIDHARVRWLMEQSIYWKNAVPNQLKVMLNPKDNL
jgi:arginine/lysine/ornithine decarboxylase